MIARAALADRGQVSLRTVPTEAAISTAAARRAKPRVAQLLSAPIAFTRRGQGAGNWPVRRLAPLLTATTYKHVIGVKFDPVKVGAALRPPLSDYLRPRAGRALEGRRQQGARALVAERHRSRCPHDRAAHDARRRAGRRRRARPRSRSASRSPS